MGIRDFTVYDMLQYNARYRTAATALMSPAGSLSHAELLGHIDGLASGLHAAGVEAGARICILAQNSFDYLELYGACARLGAIMYPINWRLSAAEVAGVVQLAEPHMLVVGAGHIEQAVEIEQGSVPVRIVLGSDQADGYQPFFELYQDETAPSVDVASNDPFVVISTAATEGVPRGAVLTHRNILTAGHETIALLGLSADTRCLGVLPLFHILGLGLALETLQVGGACVLMERFDPAVAAKMVGEFDVTMLAVFPPMLQMLLDARVDSSATFDSLKYVFGLEGPEIIQRLQTETSADFWFGFGQSETSGGVTIVRAKDRPGSAGLPYSSARLRCVDEEGEDVPVGEAGEIVVQGPMVFQGYWRDPEAIEYALRQGWLHTGDIGKLDAEGYLYYVGRKPEKELIKSGGENVYPAEVEQVLQELPQIEAVCVIGVPDPKWGEAVKAVIELTPAAMLSEDEIGAAVRDKIASYKKPRFVEFVDSLPRTESGDVDRAAVKSVHG